MTDMEWVLYFLSIAACIFIIIADLVFIFVACKENDRLRDRIKDYQKCTKDLRNKLVLRPQDYTYLCDYKENCANKILGFDADECLRCAYLKIEENKPADEASKGGADHD